MSVTKATQQYQKQYFQRAYKTLAKYGAGSGRRIYAVKLDSGEFLVATSYLMVTLPNTALRDLEWLRGVGSGPVEICVGSEHKPAGSRAQVLSKLQEFDSKATEQIFLTNLIRECGQDEIRTLIKDGEPGEPQEYLYAPREQLRLLGESYNDLSRFTFWLWREVEERMTNWTPEGRWSPEKVVEKTFRDTIIVRDGLVPVMAIMAAQAAEPFKRQVPAEEAD